jgi:putative hydrolase of the HAD superfamily
MNIRAVLCDIYQTLLEIGPPPVDAELRWTALCRTALPEATPQTLAEFALTAEGVVKREHATAKAAGIVYPEVFWPAVACEAWPALASLHRQALDDFLFEHAHLQRVVRLMPYAAEVLRSLAERDVCLGLVSNSQPYTVRELDAALSTVGLSRALFSADLCFFSFEHGFSKPDPHVFRSLAARLARRGIATAETLVVGDRDDNDISPSRAQGFQTWRIKDGSAGARGGDWQSLIEAFGGP